MSQIKLDIKDDSLDNELSELIIGKIKNVLRNDTQIKQQVKQVIDREVKKKVGQAILSVDIEKIAREQFSKEIHSSVLLMQMKEEVRRQVIQIATGKKYEEYIEEQNKVSIQKLFAEDIKNIQEQDRWNQVHVKTIKTRKVK